jgi:hypothetical protein
MVSLMHAQKRRRGPLTKEERQPIIDQLEAGLGSGYLQDENSAEQIQGQQYQTHDD